MKWHTIYNMYEGVAILAIVACWGTITFVAKPDYSAQMLPITQAMSTSLQHRTKAMLKAGKELRKDVKRNGNSREGLERIKRVRVLQQRTNKLIQKLEGWKMPLQKYRNDGKTVVAKMMLDGAKGYELKQQLDTYVNWLTKEFIDLDLPKFEKLAEGNEKKALYDNDWIKISKDFAHLHFEHVSPAIALGILTEKQLEIKRYEAEVMKKIGVGGFSSCCFCFDRIEPFVIVPSRTVQIGDEYTADLFITGKLVRARSPWTKVRMLTNKTPVPVKDGTLELTFSPGGTGTQYWTGKITYQTIDYKDTTVLLNTKLTVK